MSDERKGLLPAEEGDRRDRRRNAEYLMLSHDPLRVPLLVRVLNSLGVFRVLPKRTTFKVMAYVLTFIAYTTYHLCRKPFSVVKVVLHPLKNDTNCDGWPPFVGDHGDTLLGAVDYSWLFPYAVAMLFSGQIADRVNLRYFLTIGMLGSAISCMLLGVAYYSEMHHISYFIGVQIFGGIMQSTGWPSVVSVMSHWFGRERRGLLMGIWNIHTSLGNILGTIIPSFWANCTRSQPSPAWGLSFIIPSLIMAGAAMLIFFLLVVDPQHVGLRPPVHNPVQNSAVVADENEEKNTPHNSEEEVKGEGIAKEDSGSVQSRVRRAGSPQASRAVGFFRALSIPGVVEYALALFFNKLVSYTFLFWLPFYVQHSHPKMTSEKSDWLATLFDVGGIVGGIGTGLLSDIIDARAFSCVISLVLAVPSLFFLRFFGNGELWLFMVLLVVCGAFINGPYAVITTAVSSDLGTHSSLNNNQNAKATVTAIIDGTGSLGAALGPLLIGWLTDKYSWNVAFYMLMTSCFLSAVFMLRLLVTEVVMFARKITGIRRH